MKLTKNNFPTSLYAVGILTEILYISIILLHFQIVPMLIEIVAILNNYHFNGLLVFLFQS